MWLRQMKSVRRQDAGCTTGDVGHEDLLRLTSYAVMEAGVPGSANRAVCIRNGPSSKLRAPTEEERRHLLGGRPSFVKSWRNV